MYRKHTLNLNVQVVEFNENERLCLCVLQFDITKLASLSANLVVRPVSSKVASHELVLVLKCSFRMVIWRSYSSRSFSERLYVFEYLHRFTNIFSGVLSLNLFGSVTNSVSPIPGVLTSYVSVAYRMHSGLASKQFRRRVH